VDVVLVQPLS
jgi:hypothetical protein